jgi:hypothetical protein
MGATPTQAYAMRPARPCRAALLAGLAAALLASAAAGAAPTSSPDAAAPGLHRDLAFDLYPELARSAALAKRLLGPRSYRELTGGLATSGEALPDAYVDLAAERFAVYAPRRRPPAGYAVIVFIAPWREAALPPGWGPVLDAHGVIFVTAARSGNEESVHRRRIPLALIAAANVAARYAVDPSRIYVAGFSGGSRAAERAALEYPDFFAGAILNAGADPLGERETPIPHAALLERFQTASRVVLVTGDRDELNVGMDATARTSMRDWCVAQVRQVTMLHAGHQAATPEALAQALKALAREADPREVARSQRCRTELAGRLAADVAKARALSRAGAPPEAVAAEIDRLETRYGWLAADALAAPAD